jgi:hypothetical protein
MHGRASTTAAQKIADTFANFNIFLVPPKMTSNNVFFTVDHPQFMIRFSQPQVQDSPF